MPEMSDSEFAAAAGQSTAQTLAPQTMGALQEAVMPATKELTAGSTSIPQPSTAGIRMPDATGAEEKRQTELGKRPGVPFHAEGLDVWSDFLAKARENKEDQVRFLAKRFGPENVRMNERQEPVITITNPDTGKPEDYPLNSHELSVRSLTHLARFAPDVAMAWLAVELGGPARGTLARSLLGAFGAEEGGALRETATQALDRPLSDVDFSKNIVEHLQNVPANMLADLGLAGLIKGSQIVKSVVSGEGIPNPLARTPLTQPARPEFTAEGLEAAARNKVRSSIDPALRPSEASGIPLMAMLEMYMERKPAGASPLIQAGAKREEASKAFQRWMIDPETLMTDEEVGRRGLNALKKTIEPFQKDVELAQFAKEAEEKGIARLRESITAGAEKSLLQGERTKVLSSFGVTDIPAKGVPMAETGDLLRTKFIEQRDAFKAKANELYDKFFDDPKAKSPIISGETLKGSIDKLRAELPKVTKEVEEPTGLFDAANKPLTAPATKEIPIATPVRPRLDELSAKLDKGNVSINDLKQIRTDLDDAIKIGEAVPGVKEGRLKAAYSAVSDAITQGLKEINDPALSKAWKDATTFYRENVSRFTEKNVARLAKEAEQTSSVGNAEFVRKAIGNGDTYTALRDFYGLRSPEMGSFRNTVKNHLLEDSLGPGDVIDGGKLATSLRGLRKSNPKLFKDVFADKGSAFISAADQLASYKQKLPLEEVEKLIGPNAPTVPLTTKVARLAAAQLRLGQEYQNEVISRFLKGNLPAADLQPDKFVSFLPQAKLSDVREVMSRLQREAPDIAEQLRRKSVQNLLNESRRSPSPTDVMSKLKGEQGDIISGTGISNALGKGDQLEKYKALLGDLYEPLVDYAKTELLGEERRRVAGGVGLLAPGSAMNMFVKALTPWEGSNKAEGIFKELSGLARDKIVSVALSSKSIREWLTSPFALKDASTAIKAAIISEPFLKGMREEFNDTGALHKVLSILKVGFSTASKTAPLQPSEMTDDEFSRAAKPQTPNQ